MTKVFVHGSGHNEASWKETLTLMRSGGDIRCPNLAALLAGKPARYDALYAAFATYCDNLEGGVHLCGLSLGGILALNYALDAPAKVRSLVLIGTPHKVPKRAFALQNAVFRLLPAACFRTMAFDKRDTFALGESMKDLDFSARVHAVRCPTLVVCGAKDRANLASARFLAAQIPHAELRLLAHTGHVVNEENPAALAKLLTDYYAVYA